jgi:hypothetical protein
MTTRFVQLYEHQFVHLYEHQFVHLYEHQFVHLYEHQGVSVAGARLEARRSSWTPSKRSPIAHGSRTRAAPDGLRLAIWPKPRGTAGRGPVGPWRGSTWGADVPDSGVRGTGVQGGVQGFKSLYPHFTQ